MTQQDRDRYEKALHAMQTGVAYKMEGITDHEVQPKHLRCGVNSALCDQAALVKLLFAKGIITLDEYEKAIADEMEEEVKRYEEILSLHYRKKVNLH